MIGAELTGIVVFTDNLLLFAGVSLSDSEPALGDEGICGGGRGTARAIRGQWGPEWRVGEVNAYAQKKGVAVLGDQLVVGEVPHVMEVT